MPLIFLNYTHPSCLHSARWREVSVVCKCQAVALATLARDLFQGKMEEKVVKDMLMAVMKGCRSVY